MEQIVQFIRDQLGLGKNVQDIVSQLKAHNIDDATINQAFQVAMKTSPNSENSFVQPQSQQESPEPIDLVSDKPVVKTKFDLTRAFTIIGALLIVAAIAIIVSSTWKDMIPFVRVCFIALPMLSLFGLSYFFSKKSELYDIHDWMLGLGATIVPFFIGTFLYQFKIIPELNSTLFLTIFCLSLIFFLWLEYGHRKSYVSLLTIITIYSILDTLFVKFHLGYLSYTWLTLLVSILILICGFWLAKNKKNNSNLYVVLGTFFVSCSLPASVIATLNDKSPISTEANSIIVSIFGILFLCAASFYNKLRDYFQNNSIYFMKRYLEEIAIILIISPFLVLGTEHKFYYLISLVLSFGAILLSVRILINTLLLFGSFGLIVSVLVFSSEVFADSVGWPIIVFLAGVVAIGLGFAIRKISKIHKDEIEQMHYGLGKDPLIGQKIKISVGRIVLYIIGLIVLFNIVTFTIGQILSNNLSDNLSSNNYETEQTPDASQVVRNNNIAYDDPNQRVILTANNMTIDSMYYNEKFNITEEEYLEKMPDDPNRLVVKTEYSKTTYYITNESFFLHNGIYVPAVEALNQSKYQNRLVNVRYYEYPDYFFASEINIIDK